MQAEVTIESSGFQWFYCVTADIELKNAKQVGKLCWLEKNFVEFNLLDFTSKWN